MNHYMILFRLEIIGNYDIRSMYYLFLGFFPIDRMRFLRAVSASSSILPVETSLIPVFLSPWKISAVEAGADFLWTGSMAILESFDIFCFFFERSLDELSVEFAREEFIAVDERRADVA